MVGLKKQIKDNNFKNIYLFYGEENYLKHYYVEKIKEKVIHKDSELMNYEVIEKEMDEGYVINSMETLPFLADRRLVIIKNTNYFNAKSTVTEQLINLIKSFPTQTIVIFIEDKIDRRNKFFKAVKSCGYVVEFNYLSENDLAKWVAIELKKLGKKAEYATLIHFIRTVGTNMDQIKMELDKLCAYKIEEEMISIEDINDIATKTMEFKIFQLVDAMGMKKCEEALIVYNNLLNANEPPIRILIMLTRQFRLIYQIKTLLQEGYNISMAAKKIGVPPFVAKKCMEQGKSFKQVVLEEALEECLYIDMAIKSGQIKDRLAVELLLTKYSQ